MATVDIPQGKLRGGKAKNDNGFEYYEFLGVPYAKPPVGDLRFKSPQPPDSWKEERDATTIEKSNIACQLDFLTHKFVGSEDCLYLNVYTPNLPFTTPVKEKLPVMLFIHGGGFLSGNGIIKNDHGPDFLIEKNVVIVIINYRLSVFGFLSLDIPEVAGNMGLKDQVMALEWVKQNITYFNGDSNNVTIFGGSAGAASVEYLILSPAAKGLFHKAILQSGSVLNSWALNKKPKKSLEFLIKNLDYKGSLDNTREVYEYLMNVSANELILADIKASSYYDFKQLNFRFVPVIEKDYKNGQAFLTTHPHKMLNDGNFNKVPVLKGFCNKEASLRNLLKNKAITELSKNNNFIEYVPFDLQSSDCDLYNAKLTEAYKCKNKTEEEMSETALDFLSDLDFVSGIWMSGKIMTRAGVPLHIYEFSYVGDVNISKVFKLNVNGAGHGDDIPYLISSQFNKKFNESDALMRKRMTELWSNFAKTSNPNSATSGVGPLIWPIFSEKSSVYLNIDKEMKTKSNYEPEKIGIFEEIFKKYSECIC